MSSIARWRTGGPATWALLAGSLVAWALLLLPSQGLIMPSFCSMAPNVTDAMVWASILAFNPLASLALGWLLMVLAMMLPLLLASVEHARASVFRRRRTTVTAIVVASYVAVWTLAGIVILPLSIAARFSLGDAGAFAATGLATLVWNASPAKQRCLNRCHASPPLSSFAGRAERDALRFGIARGGWCIGNCGFLMLFTTTTGAAHVAWMIAAAIWIFGEQIERPARPAWRWRGPVTLVRIGLYTVGIIRIPAGSNLTSAVRS